MNANITYGSTKKRVNVNLLALKYFWNNNVVTIKRNISFNTLFADVDPGQLKTLNIDFFDDNTIISLPENRKRDYTFVLNIAGLLPFVQYNKNYSMLTNQRCHFLTYGNQRFVKSVRRICKEANESGFFNTVTGLNYSNLSVEFKLKFANILQQPRGGGYWIWKPFVVKRQLDCIAENDVLVYCDSGCTVNKRGEIKFKELINSVNAGNGIIGYDLMVHIEERWTTDAIFQYFSVPADNETIRKTSQFMASIIIMRKCNQTTLLINLWLKALYDNPLLFTDEYNAQTKTKIFEDNRHDQSVFSVLRKLHGCISIPDNTFASDWSTLSDVPFLTTRIRE